VSWFDIEDRVLIPIDTALNAIDVIHRSLTADGGRIYVHCMAGWNRSPTIIWLYLRACGIPSGEAARLICAQAFDAVPGHTLLVDSNLIATVQSYGRANYLPHRRPRTITAT
jgi:protein-tyrosine phosphatase